MCPITPSLEEAFAELRQQAQLLLWAYWPDTGIFAWSDAFFKLVGLPAGSAPDWPAFEHLLVPEDRGVFLFARTPDREFTRWRRKPRSDRTGV